ncbi:hypothetical protein [Nonomuraea recticatena]|uniref:Uncharacterized protein n=1 Tax=Nonomuraea recticatena TaxID=46178 RepID=A0ABP6FAV5_9ACTN
MTVLLAVYAGPVCVGRCDHRCYDADDVRCTCVCLSENHGQGLAVAVDNTRAHAERWIAAQRGSRPDVTRWSVDITVQNIPLFARPASRVQLIS